jgi:hypothetical protein
MSTHKKIEVSIQTDRVVMIWRRGCARRWCPECGREVDVVDLVQAEVLARLTARLNDGGKSRKRHSLQGLDGAVLVCVESLLSAS